MSIRLHIVCGCFPTTLTELIIGKGTIQPFIFIFTTWLFTKGEKIASPCLKVLVPASSGFPCGLVVKNPPAKVRDASSVPWLGRSPGEGNGNSLQYSFPENPMDRRPCWRQSVGCKEADMTEWLMLSLWPLYISLFFLLSYPFSSYYSLHYLKA